MRKLALIAIIALGVLPSLSACETYDSLDEALQNIPSSNSPSQSGWQYINPTVRFVTTLPKGWSVAFEEGDDTDRTVAFHNGRGAEFILRFKHMPDQGIKDFEKEILQGLSSCLPPECAYTPPTPENYLHEETNAIGESFDITIFNAKSRTLIDQHITIIEHEGWKFAFIAQATIRVDNKVWNAAEADFKYIVENFSFDLSTPTPVVCPTCTPTPS
jgi:hypothetical protein